MKSNVKNIKRRSNTKNQESIRITSSTALATVIGHMVIQECSYEKKINVPAFEKYFLLNFLGDSLTENYVIRVHYLSLSISLM